MNSIFIIVYSVLLVLIIDQLVRRNLKKFLILFGILFSYSPLMQYVIFPEYKTFEGYRSVSFDRVMFEYVNTLILLFATNIFKTIKSKTGVFNRFRVLIFLWIIFNFLSVLNSINFDRSLNAFVIAILNPILFARLFNNKLIIHNSLNFLILFFCILISFNLGVKYLSIIFNISRGVSESFLIGYGAVEFGNLRGNSATNYLSFFLPLFLFNLKYLSNKNLKKLFNVVKILLIFVFLTSGSRTGYLIIGLFIIYSFTAKKISRKQVFGLTFLLSISLTAFTYFNETSFSNFISERFTTKGSTVIDSATNDERLILWNETIEEFRENNYRGCGISNYFLIFKKYGNAHNLYINLMFERGILVFVLFVFITLFSIYICRKNIKLSIYKPVKLFFSCLLVGLIFYLIASFTGQSFLSISQTVHGFPSFVFTIFIFYPFYHFNEFYFNKK
tara:strand:+ start:497 stop:1834 length:1338 start_codon:yes stop_codon:yes gene_type:complete